MSEAADATHRGDVTDEELQEILAAHQTWLDSEGTEGKRADLTGVVDLMGGRLAGANLAGAIMPPALRRFREITHVDATVSIARPLYLVLLIACIYTMVIVFSTDDLSLVTNSPIPLIPETGLRVPVASFFVAVPVFMFGFYIYFHLYLYRLWQILGGLPSVFHDGTPLDRAVSPWLPTALVRFYQTHGVHQPSLMGLSQKWITILVVWWAVPATLVLFWVRFLVRHDWTGTALHSLLVGLAVWSALVLQRLAVAAMRGEPRPFQGLKGMLSSISRLLGICTVVVVFSIGAIEGVHSSFSLARARTWVPGVLNLVGMRSYAYLPRVAFDAKTDLRGSDLRGANLFGVSLVGADLSHADLRGANLTEANLQGANLSFARLEDATFWKAKLLYSDFSNAKLRGTILNNATITESHFRNAHLEGAKLNSANLQNVDFSNATLRKADLSDTSLTGVNFLRADLEEADLGLAKLDGANLFGARLIGTDLLGAVLKNVNLTKSTGLLQDQLDEACGENVTGLPSNLTIKPCPEEPDLPGS